MASDRRGFFLQRRVFVDSKGKYIFYGSYRLRPPVNTKVRKNMRVSVVVYPHRAQMSYNHEAWAWVFWDRNRYEEWRNY